MRLRLVVVAMAACLAACAAPAHFTEEGLASWYGRGWNGHRTASGETFNMQAMTAAHPTLPLGTVVKVTNLENGRSVKLRINDRGPNLPEDRRRIIDVSARAAAALGMTRAGLARVRIEVLSVGGEPESAAGD